MGNCCAARPARTPGHGTALLVPSSSVKAVERVPGHVRALLRIDAYEVTDDNGVRLLPG